MTSIIERRSVPVLSGDLSQRLPALLARIYAARGIRSMDELDRSLAGLLPYQALLGIDAATDLLVEALDKDERILVAGDYDADGATSCAVALRALRAMGARNIDFLVPDRFRYGYGLTPEIVDVAWLSRPQLLITVDNGIASIDGVRRANALGIKVLVTDHHLAGVELPEAAAIVNPNQPGDRFASKNLAGVGVIFYVMLALRARLRTAGWFARRGIPEPNLAQLLDLVALGTVADVVPLDRNNRILVAQGLARIRQGQSCVGIQALLRLTKRRPETCVSADLGFAIGPRINAAGRLEDMRLGIQCLLADDLTTAMDCAARLDDLNQERREIEADMNQQALEVVSRLQLGDEAGLPIGLCLFEPDWHQGVIGIVASRIKDRVHRPVIAFARAGEGQIKGSARSVPGFHIRDALDAIATRQPGLIAKFGGHAMAAGLSLDEARFGDFAAAFDDEARRHLGSAERHGVIYSDGPLAPEDLSLSVAEQLRTEGPWGQGFAEPLFDGVFELVQHRLLQERHLKLVLRPEDGTQLLDAIAFNTDHRGWPAGVERVKLAYRLDVNEYGGKRSVQLLVQHIEPL